ncbi:hypothetical protein LDENG_00217560, partial [Lucifuga dentata]
MSASSLIVYGEAVAFIISSLITRGFIQLVDLRLDTQEKTNEDIQMVVGGNFTVGARCAQHQWETRHGGIQVALSTSREIPTQGWDPREPEDKR